MLAVLFAMKIFRFRHCSRVKSTQLVAAIAAGALSLLPDAIVKEAAAQQVLVAHNGSVAPVQLPLDDIAFSQFNYTAEPLAPGEGPKRDQPEKKDDKDRMFHYSIRLGGRFVYSDNINAAPAPNEVEDFYVSLEPGISIGLGDVPERKKSYIRLDYSPNALFYFDNSEFNTFNHFIRLEAVAHLGKLTLSLFQDVSLLEGVEANFRGPNDFGDSRRDSDRWRDNRDVAGRNNIQFYNTTLMARYDFTEKASMTGAFRYNHTNYEELFTLDIYSGDLFFDYKLTPELSAGIGGAGGVVHHDDPTIDEQYQEARTRFTYDLPKRVKIDGSLGLEFRQFGRGGSLDYIAPLIDVTVAFEPAEGTRVTIGGRHRTMVSNALEGQAFTITGANVGLRQRLTERVDLNVNSGYEQASYFSVFSDVEAMRRDEYFFIDTSVDVKITDKWTAGAFYIHRENVTNLAPFGFAENQVGLRTSVSF